MFFFFFFSSRRRHTRLQGDWSSDVCSSDLSGNSAASPWSTGSSSGRSTWSRRSPRAAAAPCAGSCTCGRSEEHTSELQSPCNLVCRLLLEKKKALDRCPGDTLRADQLLGPC